LLFVNEWLSVLELYVFWPDAEADQSPVESGQGWQLRQRREDTSGTRRAGIRAIDDGS
jgi:hypothetical protein